MKKIILVSLLSVFMLSSNTALASVTTKAIKALDKTGALDSVMKGAKKVAAKRVKKTVTSGKNTLRDIIKAGHKISDGDILGAVQGVGEGVLDAAKTSLSVVGMGGTIDSARNIGGTIIGSAKDIASDISDGDVGAVMIDVGEGIVDTGKAVVDGAVDFVQDTADTVGDFVSSIFS